MLRGAEARVLVMEIESSEEGSSNTGVITDVRCVPQCMRNWGKRLNLCINIKAAKILILLESPIKLTFLLTLESPK